MLDNNVTVGKTSQSFVNPRKHNQSANVPRPQVPLGSDPMKRQYNTTTHITRQKLATYVNDYICLQTDGCTSQTEHSSKSRY